MNFEPTSVRRTSISAASELWLCLRYSMTSFAASKARVDATTGACTAGPVAGEALEEGADPGTPAGVLPAGAVFVAGARGILVSEAEVVVVALFSWSNGVEVAGTLESSVPPVGESVAAGGSVSLPTASEFLGWAVSVTVPAPAPPTAGAGCAGVWVGGPVCVEGTGRVEAGSRRSNRKLRSQQYMDCGCAAAMEKSSFWTRGASGRWSESNNCGMYNSHTFTGTVSASVSHTWCVMGRLGLSWQGVD
mmetsp:Transcript_9338/g.12662  ORF Transcript_9338/g.12662 Transcript_9338/m.12662 type:complete len:248 (-) Transcript_9338:601-1344(-)